MPKASGFNGKYQAFVVESDMEARMRLKGATTAVGHFANVRLLATTDEALAALGVSGHVDLIFISRRFDQECITGFIAAAKEKGGGRDSAYILVLTTDMQQTRVVAKNVLSGVDGFLLEPYSVDNLIEITELASRVKRERSQQREAAAFQFLIQDVMRQIDRIAYLKSCQHDVSRSFKDLKGVCSVFSSLGGESLELYLEIAVETLANAPLPDFHAKVYRGVSDRVKKVMGRKIAAELETELAGKSKPIDK
jgi:CheY-like chemotaxis protein